LIFGIEEQVLTLAAEERLVAVHPRSVNRVNGFGHERSNQTVLGRNGFDRVLQGQNIIRCSQGIGESEVNLMLPQRDLMMAHLHLETHTRQGFHQLRAHPDRLIVGRKIKIAASVHCV